MSASRKKQERKAAEEPVISTREQEEMAKAAQRKRNTLIYTIIGVVVVILAAILLIWDSGIFQRNATVATIDGEKVSAGEVAYYYYNNDVISAANTYGAYGYALPYSASASPKEQSITDSAIQEFTTVGVSIPEEYVGKTYHEYFLDYALNSLREEHALVAAAKEAGYTLSDEGKESIEASLNELDSVREQYLTTYGANLSRTKYLQQIFGSTMTEKTYKNCMKNSQLATEFYNNHFETVANYTEDELTAYYEENKASLESVTYYWRSFDGTVESTKDEDGKTVEPTEEETTAALAAAKEEAEAAVAEINGKLDLVKDNEDYTEASGVLTPGSFYYDWLMDESRQSGDATVIDNTVGTGYYVVVFGDRFLDETPTVNVRHILVEAKNEDDPATEDVNESTKAPTEEAFAAAKAKAEDLLAQWKAGEATEESFAALVADNSADTGSNANGGLYEKVAKGSMIPNFNDWIFDEARQSGDVSEPIQNTENYTQGWHLIYYIGQDEPVWVTTARQAKWASDLEANVEIVRTDKLDLIVD